MTWKIWYTPDRHSSDTFSSEDGAPEDAPREGVQVIAELRDGRRITWVFGDLYCWTGAGWNTAIVCRKTWPAGAPILTGELIEFDTFKAIRVEADRWLSDQV